MSAMQSVTSGMNTAVNLPPSDGMKSAGHVGQRKSQLSEHGAKVRASQKRIADARQLKEITFPSDAICRSVVHACFDLRRSGFRDGEIDDAVGARYGLEGWLVQHIVIYFAEMKVRELEATISLQKGIIEAAKQLSTQTWEDAPGRVW